MKEDDPVLPDFQSHEDFGKFVLNNDMSKYMKSPNAARLSAPVLKRSGHVVPVELNDEQYATLSKLAELKHESLKNLVSQILNNGLREMLPPV